MSYWQSNAVDWEEQEPKGRLGFYWLAATQHLLVWLLIHAPLLAVLLNELISPDPSLRLSAPAFIGVGLSVYLALLFGYAEVIWRGNCKAHRKEGGEPSPVFPSEARIFLQKYQHSFVRYFRVWFTVGFLAAGGWIAFFAWQVVTTSPSERINLQMLLLGVGFIASQPLWLRLQWQNNLIAAKQGTLKA